MEVWITGVVKAIVCASQNRKHLVSLKNAAKWRQWFPVFCVLMGLAFVRVIK